MAKLNPEYSESMVKKIFDGNLRINLKSSGRDFIGHYIDLDEFNKITSSNIHSKEMHSVIFDRLFAFWLESDQETFFDGMTKMFPDCCPYKDDANFLDSREYKSDVNITDSREHKNESFDNNSDLFSAFFGKKSSNKDNDKEGNESNFSQTKTAPFGIADNGGDVI